MNHFLTHSVLCVTACLLVQDVNADGIRINLTPSVSKIRAEDPLFVTVEITNTSDVEIVFNRPISVLDGTIDFEVRSVGTKSFSLAPRGLQVLGFGDVPDHLAPEETYTAHEVVLRSGKISVFAERGKYELRARIVGVKGLDGVSKVVPITVISIPNDERAAIQNASRLMLVTIRSQIISNHPGVLDELVMLRNKLTKSNVRSTLDWVIAVVKLREASSQVNEMAAKKSLAEIELGLDKVTRQRFAIVQAREYIRLRRLDDARREIRKLEARSASMRTLEILYEEMRRRIERESRSKPVPIN